MLQILRDPYTLFLDQRYMLLIGSLKLCTGPDRSSSSEKIQRDSSIYMVSVFVSALICHNFIRSLSIVSIS